MKLFTESDLIGTFAGTQKITPSCSKGELLDSFSLVMEELLGMRQKECIMGGGFHVDWFKTDDYNTNRLKSCIYGAGLKQMVTEAARITKDRETLIDLVLTDNKNLVCTVLHGPKPWIIV